MLNKSNKRLLRTDNTGGFIKPSLLEPEEVELSRWTTGVACVSAVAVMAAARGCWATPVGRDEEARRVSPSGVVPAAGLWGTSRRQVGDLPATRPPVWGQTVGQVFHIPYFPD